MFEFKRKKPFRNCFITLRILQRQEEHRGLLSVHTVTVLECESAGMYFEGVLVSFLLSHIH